MKIKKVGKLLKKLNNLYDNIKDDGGISQIEKDLFLSYLKDIYEASLDGSDDASRSTSIDDTPIASGHLSSSLADIPQAIDDEPGSSDEVEFVEEEERLEKKTSSAPRSTENTNSHRVNDNKGLSQSTLDTFNKLHPDSEVEVVTVVDAPAVVYSDDMLSLFEEVEISEVSERLSMTPVSDLTKAMGINEKIFTVRELFDKDQTLFKNTMAHLNTCADFSEAKKYLMAGVATDLGWDDPAKSKKAINFIRLVQRRFR